MDSVKKFAYIIILILKIIENPMHGKNVSTSVMIT